MLIDDEFAVFGSANIGQRSFTHDNEMDIAVVDANNNFVREFRYALFNKHLPSFQPFDPSSEDIPPDVNPPISSYLFYEFNQLKNGIINSVDNLRPYDPSIIGYGPWIGYSTVLNAFVAPYAGPYKLRAINY